MSGISAQYADGLELRIKELGEQVEKLTKERDALRSRRCEVCGYLEHEREHTGCLREQVAALAEQNEKMRNVTYKLGGYCEAAEWFFPRKQLQTFGAT